MMYASVLKLDTQLREQQQQRRRTFKIGCVIRAKTSSRLHQITHKTNNETLSDVLDTKTSSEMRLVTKRHVGLNKYLNESKLTSLTIPLPNIFTNKSCKIPLIFSTIERINDVNISLRFVDVSSWCIFGVARLCRTFVRESVKWTLIACKWALHCFFPAFITISVPVLINKR